MTITPPAPATVITAIGTPLNDYESLHVEGLAATIADQFDNGIDGLLVAGTMGLLQLLTDSTYRELVERSVPLAEGRGELLVGAGDAGFARTRERITFLNCLPIDGTVVLSPYLLKFSQDELVSYFSRLADHSSHPLYLYDLPGLTGTRLEVPTVLKLAAHGNIRGIKCSGDLANTRHLIDVAPAGFRVIVASPELVDMTTQWGVRDQLDGIFAAAPAWTRSIVDEAVAGNAAAAARWQRKLTQLLAVLKQHGVFQAFTTILNARGIRGNFSPAPLRTPTAAERAAILSAPIVRELLADHPMAGEARTSGTPAVVAAV